LICLNKVDSPLAVERIKEVSAQHQNETIRPVCARGELLSILLRSHNLIDDNLNLSNKANISDCLLLLFFNY